MNESTKQVTINLISLSKDGTLILTFVEEGPWKDREHEQRRIQENLYNTIDVILDGKLYEHNKKSSNKNVLIRLDCYDILEDQISEFFNNFSKFIENSDEYQADIKSSHFIASLNFELNLKELNQKT